MPRSPVATALALAFMTVALAACGSGASTASNSMPPTAATTTSTATPPSSTSDSPTSAPGPVITESNPPGDIPDNQAFVTYKGTSGNYSVQVPEGWARTAGGASAAFSDKLNGIAITQAPAATAATVASATAVDVPTLKNSVPRFALGKVTTFTRAGGSGVLITYLADSSQDPVTNKVVRDAVEQYLFWKNGQQVTLTLTGPQNADNVDPWAKVSGSFRWTV